MVIMSVAAMADPSLLYVKGGVLPSTGGNGTGTKIESLYWARDLVTYGEWMLFVNASYRSFDVERIGMDIYQMDPGSKIPSDFPMLGVTWLEAIKYCNWKSEKDGRKPVYTIRGDFPFVFTPDVTAQLPTVLEDKYANGYRLPTSAEWEYAAKGGSKGIANKWWKTADQLKYGVFYENSSGIVRRVRTLAPNPLGLFDMVGLAKEWCWDSKTEGALGVSSRGKEVRGADFGNSLKEWPDRVVDGKLVSHPGVPDYYTAEMAMDGLARDTIGFRLVTNSP